MDNSFPSWFLPLVPSNPIQYSHPIQENLPHYSFQDDCHSAKTLWSQYSKTSRYAAVGVRTLQLRVFELGSKTLEICRFFADFSPFFAKFAMIFWVLSNLMMRGFWKKQFFMEPKPCNSRPYCIVWLVFGYISMGLVLQIYLVDMRNTNHFEDKTLQSHTALFHQICFTGR